GFLARSAAENIGAVSAPRAAALRATFAGRLAGHGEPMGRSRCVVETYRMGDAHGQECRSQNETSGCRRERARGYIGGAHPSCNFESRERRARRRLVTSEPGVSTAMNNAATLIVPCGNLALFQKK